MPGWKQRRRAQPRRGHRAHRPDVQKAVNWNSPFYGIEGKGWFLNFHCFTKYVKVAFFRGTSLNPLPPGESKHEDVRYLDIHENDQLDQELLARWVRQASKLPGWVRSIRRPRPGHSMPGRHPERRRTQARVGEWA